MRFGASLRSVVSLLFLGGWLMAGGVAAVTAAPGDPAADLIPAGEKEADFKAAVVRSQAAAPVPAGEQQAGGETDAGPQQETTVLVGETDEPGSVRARAVAPPRRPAGKSLTAKTVRRQPAAAGGSQDEAGEDDLEERYVTIDFDNVDIGLFIKYISELTGKNFVIDKAVKGNITIISPTKISEDEAYKVFESVLEVQGFTTVPAGSIIKVVPAVEARSKSVETGLSQGDEEVTDKVVTQLIPIEFADVEELKKLFAPLVSKTSVVISYAPTNMLIVTDVLSNIRRLLQIIKEIDLPDYGEEISIVPLRYATASEIAQMLNSLFPPQAKTTTTARKTTNRRGTATPSTPVGSTSAVKILSDERTNVLIIMASADDTVRITQLIELLDREIPRGEGDIHVYYLQNAKAEDLAKVLTSLPRESSKAADKGTAPVISTDVKITSDKATNALVITAKKDDYYILEDVIKKLDIPRDMVYLEALLMEVKVDKEFSVGVEWLGGFSFNDGNGAAFGVSTPSDGAAKLLGLATGAVLPSKGLTMGVIGDTITIGNQTYPSIGAIFNAYKSDSDVHIISRPQILTTDNEEAEIIVGENVPYLTRRDESTTTGYENYEYKDVGVTLKITPQINRQGVVRLQIFQEIQKVTGGADVARPTTLKRSANTTVLVKDNNTVVIGGIIGDDIDDSHFKVPLLGDIPVLGYLFQSHSSTKKRTNLYIFITPRIIRNPAEAALIYQEKKFDADYHHEKGFEAFENISGQKHDERKEGVARYDKTDMDYATLGYEALQAGHAELARKYLEQALQLNPDNLYGLLNMGLLYEADGNKAMASLMYERVIATVPNDPDADREEKERLRKLLQTAMDNLAALTEE